MGKNIVLKIWGQKLPQWAQNEVFQLLSIVNSSFWSFWAKRAPIDAPKIFWKINSWNFSYLVQLFFCFFVVFFEVFGGKKPLWFSCQIVLVSFAFYNQRFLFFTCLFPLMFHYAKDSKCTLDWKKYLKTTKRSQNDLYWIFRLAI